MPLFYSKGTKIVKTFNFNFTQYDTQFQRVEVVLEYVEMLNLELRTQTEDYMWKGEENL